MTVLWTGRQQQASTTMVSEDLFIPAFNMPVSVKNESNEFYRQVRRDDRDGFQEFLNTLSGQEKIHFYDLYKEMCNRVAIRSAEEFNQHLASLPTNAKTAVYENFVKQFFRIDHVPYILTDIDNRQDFDVRIPDLTTGSLKNLDFGFEDKTKGQYFQFDIKF